MDPIEIATMRRVYWRVIPLLFAAMFFNYLDRINIGFAALGMNRALGLTPAIFGFGASIFFLGYMVLEVPSNLMLHRLGARIWIARILMSWGLLAALMAFVVGPTSFVALRFLIGVAEAGFLPGLALYVTYWFPAAYRARAVGGYIIAGQVSAVVGGPVSTALLTWCDGVGGLAGWQWMFLLEGVPAVLLGLVVLALLPERPETARFLPDAERAWLVARLAAERRQTEHGHRFRMAEVASDPRVWTLAAMFGCALVGIYGFLIWLPQIIKAFGHLSNIEVGFLSALPPLLGVAGTLAVSWTSDRTGDRKLHLAGLYGVAAVLLAASALVPDKLVSYILLTLAGASLYSGNSLFWSLNASLMTGIAAAASIALVNTLAQFGGLVGPWMIGLVRGATGSFSDALLAIAAFLLVAALISLVMRVTPRRANPLGEARS